MYHITLPERFLLFSAALDPEIYSKCTPTEQQRLLTNGVFVLIPTFVAYFSGTYASPLLFDNPISEFLFPFAFALIIYSIDRAIVMYTKAGEYNFPMLIRFLLAFSLSIIMAEPLVLHIYRDEVTAEEFRKEKQIETHYDSLLRLFVKPSEDQIKTNDSIVDQSLYLYSIETDGSGGTRTAGIGEIAREKKSIWEQQKKTKDEQNAQIAKGIEHLKKSYDEKKQAALAAIPKGIAGKMSVLHELANDSFIIWISSFMLRLILILLDILPILLKLIPLKKREDLYSHLLLQKHDCYFDAVNDQIELTYKTILNKVKLISEDQDQSSELGFAQGTGDNFRKHLQTLTNEWNELYRSKKDAEISIDRSVKDEKLKKIYLNQIQSEFEQFNKKMILKRNILKEQPANVPD
jgi:hypothetical protein